jgi:A/G-specific adenine glycosylase
MIYDALPRTCYADLTQALMEFGARVCVPNAIPICADCPAHKFCIAFRENLTRILPVRAEKKAKREETLTVFVLMCAGRMALVRRKDAGLLAGLWELPNVSGEYDVGQAADWVRAQGLIPMSITASKKHTHVFTHIRWHMYPFVIECADPAASTPSGIAARNHRDQIDADGNHTGSAMFVWVSPSDVMESFALPTAFAKILSDFRREASHASG